MMKLADSVSDLASVVESWAPSGENRLPSPRSLPTLPCVRAAVDRHGLDGLPSESWRWSRNQELPTFVGTRPPPPASVTSAIIRVSPGTGEPSISAASGATDEHSLRESA